jgi:NitT/TauT family transport system substrate-binding protein
LFGVVSVAAALIAAQALPIARAADAPLKLAVNMTTVESIPVFLAAEGRPVTVSAGGIPQLLDGTADAATNFETQALLRSVAAPNLRIILTVAECYYRLVGRRSAGIQRVSDLRGKKIGTPANTSSHYYLALMLGREKLTEADVTVVPMAVNLMGAAMQKGEVDAVSGWEPGAQDAIDGLGRDAVVFQDRSVYRELFDLNTTTEVLNDPTKRRALVEVVRGMLTASEQVRARPSDGWPLLSSKIKMPVPTISAVWRHFRFAGGLPADLVDVLTEEERWVAGVQQRQPRGRQALAALVDSTVLRDARRGAR